MREKRNNGNGEFFFEICTLKHLVYKLWVSDCEIETGDKKKAKMLHQPPLPTQLTIWIYLISFL